MPATGKDLKVTAVAGVYFRPLSLEHIAALLQQHDFGAAFTSAQSMRVDLNYLVDFLGPAFEQYAADFVQQINNPDALCDLVSALKPGSCIAPGCKYAVAAPAAQGGATDRGPAALLGASHARGGQSGSDATSAEFEGKVARCCAALRSACEKRGGAFLRVAIMSHLRCVLAPICSLRQLLNAAWALSRGECLFRVASAVI